MTLALSVYLDWEIGIKKLLQRKNSTQADTWQIYPHFVWHTVFISHQGPLTSTQYSPAMTLRLDIIMLIYCNEGLIALFGPTTPSENISPPPPPPPPHHHLAMTILLWTFVWFPIYEVELIPSSPPPPPASFYGPPLSHEGIKTKIKQMPRHGSSSLYYAWTSMWS